ncbi:MAG: hypothetical protein KAG06_05845, partial [Methylococcales bacterium]|nr:hypothetical protein [Methylococcales bacterium]
RFLYYHLISMVEQVGGFKEYGFDKTVYTIVVLTSTPRDDSVNFSYAVSNMNPIDEHQRIVDVYPHQLVFLCPRQANKKTPPKIKKWLDFIEDSLDGKIENSDYPDTLSEIKDEMAWSNAKTRFIDEGRKEGIEKGKEEEREKIILQARKMGLDDEAIAQLIK